MYNDGEGGCCPDRHGKDTSDDQSDCCLKVQVPGLGWINGGLALSFLFKVLQVY